MDSITIPVNINFSLEVSLTGAYNQAQNAVDAYFAKNKDYFDLQITQMADQLFKHYVDERIKKEMEYRMQSVVSSVVDLERIRKAAKKARAEVISEIRSKVNDEGSNL